jgi:SNF2 family DNA or RNA helicase
MSDLFDIIEEDESKPKNIQDPPRIAELRQTLGLEACPLKPYIHQVAGIEKLVTQPIFYLGDEMGAGKSLQVIASAHVLFLRGIIDHVLIIGPSSVIVGVWFDPELSELAKHLWPGIASEINLYRGKGRKWLWPNQKPIAYRLKFTIANYEYLRSKERLVPLLKTCNKKTLLILDESACIKSRKAQQTKACVKIRKKVGRICLLNGTPISQSPVDMLSQGNIMNPAILDCPSKAHFMSRYAVTTKKFGFDKVIGWQNIEDLQQRFAPYILRRLKKDCLDLPPKLPPVTLTATLTPETWKIYKEMRDSLVVWLRNPNNIVTASQIVVKMIRLSQITSGFIGGLEEAPDFENTLIEKPQRPDRPSFIVRPGFTELPVMPGTTVEGFSKVREISREKLDVFLEFYENRIQEELALKLLAWCRFRPEHSRVIRELRQHYPDLAIGQIRGGQKKEERQDAIRLLDPRTMSVDQPATVVTTEAGSLGLNLAGCHTVVRLSQGYSLYKALQGEDRVHRPGQTHAVSYFDILAEGPNGQKTIDHSVAKVLRQKLDIATWTTSAWVSALEE